MYCNFLLDYLDDSVDIFEIHFTSAVSNTVANRIGSTMNPLGESR